jgi:hypothetical protein
VQTLTPDTVPIVIKDENVELRMAEVGEMAVSFIRLTEGTDLGPALVGLDGDSCPCPHWGYMLEGRLLMRATGNDRTYEAGQAFYWAPGHVPFALTDCAYVDFSPRTEFNAVIAHITRT